MHYYRFRPFSELCLKELLYSEIYFASPEECNDPFDSKAFYKFSGDEKKWARVLMLAAENQHLRLDLKGIDRLAKHISSNCPLSFNDVLSKNFFSDVLDANPKDKAGLQMLYDGVCTVMKVYQPAMRYFVSFSRVSDEFLMWSHYADSHKGYCLIFKAIDGKLNQSPIYRKKSIRRATPNGFVSEMSYSLPEGFIFTDIDYRNEVEHLDAFLHMPVYVSGEANSEEERDSILMQQQSHFYQKGQSWQYEKESRLILHPPPSWLFGDHVTYTRQERLFHYEPSQLAGIIYGAKMAAENKNRIRELLQERKEWVSLNHHYKRTSFHFMEFEARLSQNQRTVEILPVGVNLPAQLTVIDKDFDRLYKDWKEGIGFEREGNHSKRIMVP